MTDKNAKLHENYDWMHTAWLSKGMSAKEISDELNISVKLVHIWLKQHNLV